jgi:hypothetical protein
MDLLHMVINDLATELPTTVPPTGALLLALQQRNGVPAKRPGAGGVQEGNHGSSGRRPPGRRQVLNEFGVAGLGAGVVTGQRRRDLLDHLGAGPPIRHLPHPPLWGDPQAGRLHQPPAMHQRLDWGFIGRELAAPAAADAPAARGRADDDATAHLATSLL